jgi:hypothetical protein
MRGLAIAQLGSRGTIDGDEFVRRLAEATIRVLIPKLFRDAAIASAELLAAADRCEREGTLEAARVPSRATAAAYASEATYAAAYAAAAAWEASEAAEAAEAAAEAADWAAEAAWSVDYLRLSASLAIEVLRELDAPGIRLMDELI